MVECTGGGLGLQSSVRIVSIGGGPAGLSFAILMKKADPAHDVTVIERNRPEETFGFGVVLGFFDHSRGQFQAIGLRNFREILGSPAFYATLAVGVVSIPPASGTDDSVAAVSSVFLDGARPIPSTPSADAPGAPRGEAPAARGETLGGSTRR